MGRHRSVNIMSDLIDVLTLIELNRYRGRAPW
jgi:hypothetical protein